MAHDVNYTPTTISIDPQEWLDMKRELALLQAFKEAHSELFKAWEIAIKERPPLLKRVDPRNPVDTQKIYGKVEDFLKSHAMQHPEKVHISLVPEANDVRTWWPELLKNYPDEAFGLPGYTDTLTREYWINTANAGPQEVGERIAKAINGRQEVYASKEECVARKHDEQPTSTDSLVDRFTKQQSDETYLANLKAHVDNGGVIVDQSGNRIRQSSLPKSQSKAKYEYSSPEGVNVWHYDSWKPLEKIIGNGSQNWHIKPTALSHSEIITELKLGRKFASDDGIVIGLGRADGVCSSADPIGVVIPWESVVEQVLSKHTQWSRV